MIRKYLFLILIGLPVILYSQENYPDKKVSIENKHFTLKDAFSIMNAQTACIFSYDPSKINDKQEIRTNALNNISLKSALQKILPRNIHFNFTGKYVILEPTGNYSPNVVKRDKAKIVTTKKMKSETNHKVSNTYYNAKPEVNLNIKKDSIIDTLAISKIEIPVNVDSTMSSMNIKNNDSNAGSLPQTAINLNSLHTQNKSLSAISDTFVENKIATLKSKNSKRILELGMGADSHLLALTTRIGYGSFYSLIGLGSDYNKTYHLGLGFGVNFKYNKIWGLNIDLMRFGIVGGRSFKLNVRSATYEISPAIHLGISKNIYILAGGSVFLINSGYLDLNSTTDLGRFGGFSPKAGIIFKI